MSAIFTSHSLWNLSGKDPVASRVVLLFDRNLGSVLPYRMQNEKSPLFSVFVLIAVAFAAMVPERAITRIDFPQSESQPKSVSQLNVDRATSFGITDLSGVKSTSETLPAIFSIPAQEPAESSSGEMSGQMQSSAGSSLPGDQTSVSEITDPNAETNTNEVSPAHRMLSARASKKNAPKQRFAKI